MMFQYKCIGTGQLEWFNTDHVLLVKQTKSVGGLEVEFINGSSIILADNWKDRDDVARFKENMGMM